jgi:hypothetical protein
MTKTQQQITNTATDLGYTTTIERGQLTARDTTGAIRIMATFAGTRFAGGSTIDHMGHLTSHDTARALITFAQTYTAAAA